MPTVAKIQELPVDQVFKTFVEDFGMTKDGRRTKNPWMKDPLPKEITNSPIEFYIYNIGPIQQTINAGSMGQHILFPPDAEGKLARPLEIRKYMVDWSDQGDYKQKPVLVEGATVAREWVTPNGEKGNTDLRNWGVFYSKHNPPLAEEVAVAQRLLDNTLDTLIKIADGLHSDITKRREITEVYRIAAKARHAERPWCAESKAMGRCAGCGRGVELDIAKCSCGAVLNWELARKLRLITKAEFDEAVADGLATGPITPVRVADAKGR
jgi:hypothetical protein